MRGTNYEQDSRFSNKQQVMISKSIWPDEYDKRVKLQKVDMELVKMWIHQKVQDLMGEDDIAANTAISLLEQDADTLNGPDPKKMHFSMAGVMSQETTSKFMIDLWRLLLEAQDAVGGVPPSLLERKRKQEEAKRIELQQLENKRAAMKSGHKDQKARLNKQASERLLQHHTADNRPSQETPKQIVKEQRERKTYRRSRSRSRSGRKERRLKQERREQRSNRRDRSRSQKKKTERKRKRERQEREARRRKQKERRAKEEARRKKNKKRRRDDSSDSSSSGVSSSSSSSSSDQSSSASSSSSSSSSQSEAQSK